MPATIFVSQPRPAYASAKVPWISSHARTQRPQTMHSFEIHLDVRVPVVLRVRVALALVAALREAEVARDLAELVAVLGALGAGPREDVASGSRERTSSTTPLATRCAVSSFVSTTMPSRTGVVHAATGPRAPAHADHAHAAGAERREALVVAERRDVDAFAARDVEDGRAIARLRPRARRSSSVTSLRFWPLARRRAAVAAHRAPPRHLGLEVANSDADRDRGSRRRARRASRASASRRARRGARRPPRRSARSRGSLRRFAISRPRRPPIRHGKHFPHDSASQNSKRWMAMSRTSTRVVPRDDAAVAEQRAHGVELLEAERRVERACREDAAERAADLHGLDRPAALHAAADRLEDARAATCRAAPRRCRAARSARSARRPSCRGSCRRRASRRRRRRGGRSSRRSRASRRC